MLYFLDPNNDIVINSVTHRIENSIADSNNNEHLDIYGKLF